MWLAAVDTSRELRDRAREEAISANVETTNPASQEIVRRHLLTASFDKQKTVDRVEIKEVTLSAGQSTGLHLHPCPVVGYVIEGSILFQIEGQPAKDLKVGDAFYEPAHTRITHFDSVAGKPEKFIAYYLVGLRDQELITTLEEGQG